MPAACARLGFHTQPPSGGLCSWCQTALCVALVCGTRDSTNAPAQKHSATRSTRVVCAQVFWEGDGAWYRGSVTGYSATTQRHTILYDDNDIERVVLDAVPHRCMTAKCIPNCAERLPVASLIVCASPAQPMVPHDTCQVLVAARFCARAHGLTGVDANMTSVISMHINVGVAPAGG